MPDLPALRAARRALILASLRRPLTVGEEAELCRISRRVSEWATRCDPAYLDSRCDDCRRRGEAVRYSAHDAATLCPACWASRPRDRATGMPGRECGGK